MTESKDIKEIMKEKNARYQATFMEKHKERIVAKVVCDECGGAYTYYNKSHHRNSKKHLYIVEFKIRLKNELSGNVE
jgi:hypothetical protein